MPVADSWYALASRIASPLSGREAFAREGYAMSYQGASDADDLEHMREDELHGTTTYRDKYRYLDAREDAERLVFGGDGPFVDLALVRRIAERKPIDSAKPAESELIRRGLIVSVGEGWELSERGEALHAALVFLYGPIK